MQLSPDSYVLLSISILSLACKAVVAGVVDREGDDK
jgi:hypothetical protein